MAETAGPEPDHLPSPFMGEVLEQREELLDAVLALEHALSLPARDAAWPTRVRAGLDELAGALVRHTEVTEAPDGLFDQVMAGSPTLAAPVDRLRREHVTLQSGIEVGRRLVAAAAANAGDTDAVEHARDEIVDLIRRFLRHRQRGADLLYDAYAVDVGAGD